MLTKSPLKVVLADANYENYLHLKHILALKCSSFCNLFWFGNQQQCLAALAGGKFDLALVVSGPDTTGFMETIRQSPHHTPIVLMVEDVTRDNAMEASKAGLFGIIDRQHLDDDALAYYLASAELFHQHELEDDGFFADVSVIGHQCRPQHGYTYIH